MNQECGYYGKLVCSVCDSGEEHDEEASVYREPEDGYWPAWLAVAILVMLVVWYASSFMIAVLLAILTYVVGGFLLHRSGVNLFGREREIQQQRKTRT